jgi:dTDP-4-dehydrorhamnose 3,5-epimerase
MFKKPTIYKQNKRYFDKRGFFQEIFLKKKTKINFIFSAIASSKQKVIRGLHFQTQNKQTKFIYIVKGKILDVIVNLNKKSKNFGKVYKFKMKEGDSLIVPNNYAHGYECLSKTCTVLYYLDNYRDKKAENGIMYNDKDLKIKWISKTPILSNRDRKGLSFNEFKKKIISL